MNGPLSTHSRSGVRVAAQQRTTAGVHEYPTPVRIAAMLSALILFLVPSNFVMLDPIARWAVLLAALVGAGIFVVGAIFSRGGEWRSVLIVLTVIAATNLIVGRDVQSLLGLLTTLMAGLALALVWPRRLDLVLVVVIVLDVTTLLVDFVLGSGSVSSLFGSQIFLPSEVAANRPRGILGHAVPAGTVAVYCLLAGLVLRRRRAISGRLLSLLVVGATMSIWLSGTRSALLVLAIGLVAAFFVPPLPTKINPAAVVASIAALVLVALNWSAIWRSIGGGRLFSFHELEGSVSLQNRFYAGDVLALWPEYCAGPCRVFGSGARSLQATLHDYVGVFGISTVDNVFLSVLWDFGLLGLACLVVVLALAVARLWSRTSTANQAAAALAVLAILVSGFVYDSLYIQSTAVLFGYFLGLALVHARGGKVDLVGEHPAAERRREQVQRPGGGPASARRDHPHLVSSRGVLDDRVGDS